MYKTSAQCVIRHLYWNDIEVEVAESNEATNKTKEAVWKYSNSVYFGKSFLASNYQCIEMHKP